jgi:hypothetical protein
MLEYLRARASNAGGGDIVTVTVGERAMRVICCSAGIHFGGVFVGHAKLVATLALAALAAASLVGLVQLIVASAANSSVCRARPADKAGHDAG